MFVISNKLSVVIIFEHQKYKWVTRILLMLTRIMYNLCGKFRHLSRTLCLLKNKTYEHIKTIFFLLLSQQIVFGYLLMNKYMINQQY